MADVKWTFFADTAAAERAIQRLEQQNAKLENALAQVAKRGRDAGSALEQTFNRTFSAANMASTAINLIKTAIVEAGEAQREFDAGASQLATRYDVAIRKFRILGNLNAVEGEDAKKSIQSVSTELGFTNEQGLNAARELVSAGFDPKQAQGPALKSLLRSLAANQEFDVNADAGPLAKSAASYLQSQGQDLTGENLERIGVFIKKLADISTVSIADVQEIAKHGATMSGKLTQQEQFAAVTRLIQEGRPGSEAANAVEKVVLSLTGKGDKKKTQEALKEIGLQGTDVDMIGESFLESLKRLDKGLKGIDETRRDTVLTKLFGVEHISSAKSLIQRNAEVAELTAVQDDRPGFERAVKIASEGRAAGGRRLTAIEEAYDEQHAPRWNDEDVKRAMRIVMKAEGFGVYDVRKSQEYYDNLRGYVGNQETALALTPGTGGVPGVYTGDVQKKIVELLERTAKSSEEQAAAMKANKPALNRNAQGEGAP